MVTLRRRNNPIPNTWNFSVSNVWLTERNTQNVYRGQSPDGKMSSVQERPEGLTLEIVAEAEFILSCDV
jgi:hypothetical protein